MQLLKYRRVFVLKSQRRLVGATVESGVYKGEESGSLTGAGSELSPEARRRHEGQHRQQVLEGLDKFEKIRLAIKAGTPLNVRELNSKSCTAATPGDSTCGSDDSGSSASSVGHESGDSPRKPSSSTTTTTTTTTFIFRDVHGPPGPNTMHASSSDSADPPAAPHRAKGKRLRKYRAHPRRNPAAATTAASRPPPPAAADRACHAPPPAAGGPDGKELGRCLHVGGVRPPKTRLKGTGKRTRRYPAVWRTMESRLHAELEANVARRAQEFRDELHRTLGTGTATASGRVVPLSQMVAQEVEQRQRLAGSVRVQTQRSRRWRRLGALLLIGTVAGCVATGDSIRVSDVTSSCVAAAPGESPDFLERPLLCTSIFFKSTSSQANDPWHGRPVRVPSETSRAPPFRSLSPVSPSHFGFEGWSGTMPVAQGVAVSDLPSAISTISDKKPDSVQNAPQRVIERHFDSGIRLSTASEASTTTAPSGSMTHRRQVDKEEVHTTPSSTATFRRLDEASLPVLNEASRSLLGSHVLVSSASPPFTDSAPTLHEAPADNSSSVHSHGRKSNGTTVSADTVSTVSTVSSRSTTRMRQLPEPCMPQSPGTNTTATTESSNSGFPVASASRASRIANVNPITAGIESPTLSPSSWQVTSTSPHPADTKLSPGRTTTTHELAAGPAMVLPTVYSQPDLMTTSTVSSNKSWIHADVSPTTERAAVHISAGRPATSSGASNLPPFRTLLQRALQMPRQPTLVETTPPPSPPPTVRSSQSNASDDFFKGIHNCEQEWVRITPRGHIIEE
eukprot:gene4261-6583_t